MKKLLVLAALAGFLGAQQCLAFTVNVSRTGGYYGDGGGEFTITDPPDPIFDAIYANYATEATIGNGFQTFCVSTSIGLQGNPLDATLNPNGVAVGTAWLYEAFAKGTLDYNYVIGPGRTNSAIQLQNTIWELQGQAYDPALAAFYANMAATHFGSLDNAKVVEVGNVDILDMTSNGTGSQPMLALVGGGVPDGGATLMLLGLGLSSLGAFSRRFRA